MQITIDNIELPVNELTITQGTLEVRCFTDIIPSITLIGKRVTIKYTEYTFEAIVDRMYFADSILEIGLTLSHVN